MTLPLPVTDPTMVRCRGLRANGRPCRLPLLREPWRSLRMGEDCAERAGLVLPVRGQAVVGSGPDLLDMIDEGTKMTDYALRVLDVVARADLHDSIWWRTDARFAPVTFFVNCSNVFSWGSADLEDLTPERLEAFEQALKDCTDTAGSNAYGPELFCARMRGSRPQGAAYPEDERLWPLFDACGPERETGLGNPYRPGERRARGSAEERSDDPSKTSKITVTEPTKEN